MNTEDKTYLATEILAYLSRNPEACDTLEGIARFWLMRRRVDREYEEVEGAVRELVSRGLLEERVFRSIVGHSTTSLFRLNPMHIRDIETLLHDHHCT